MSLNAALDRVERGTRGRAALRAITLGTTTVVTVAVGMAVGSTTASGCCNNCCWGYQGYQCDSLGGVRELPISHAH